MFIQAIANNGYDPNIELSCFELFDTEASKALDRCKLNNFSNATITEGDFLVWANECLKKNKPIFDGVLGILHSSVISFLKEISKNKLNWSSNIST